MNKGGKTECSIKADLAHCEITAHFGLMMPELCRFCMAGGVALCSVETAVVRRLNVGVVAVAARVDTGGGGVGVSAARPSRVLLVLLLLVPEVERFAMALWPLVLVDTGACFVGVAVLPPPLRLSRRLRPLSSVPAGKPDAWACAASDCFDLAASSDRASEREGNMPSIVVPVLVAAAAIVVVVVAARCSCSGSCSGS